jgi:hypothetical protein
MLVEHADIYGHQLNYLGMFMLPNFSHKLEYVRYLHINKDANL